MTCTGRCGGDKGHRPTVQEQGWSPGLRSERRGCSIAVFDSFGCTVLICDTVVYIDSERKAAEGKGVDGVDDLGPRNRAFAFSSRTAALLVLLSTISSFAWLVNPPPTLADSESR